MTHSFDYVGRTISRMLQHYRNAWYEGVSCFHCRMRGAVCCNVNCDGVCEMSPRPGVAHRLSALPSIPPPAYGILGRFAVKGTVWSGRVRVTRGTSLAGVVVSTTDMSTDQQERGATILCSSRRIAKCSIWDTFAEASIVEPRALPQVVCSDKLTVGFASANCADELRNNSRRSADIWTRKIRTETPRLNKLRGIGSTDDG